MACASEQNIKSALMFYRERSQGSPKAVCLRNFWKQEFSNLKEKLGQIYIHPSLHYY